LKLFATLEKMSLLLGNVVVELPSKAISTGLKVEHSSGENI